MRENEQIESVLARFLSPATWSCNFHIIRPRHPAHLLSPTRSLDIEWEGNGHARRADHGKIVQDQRIPEGLNIKDTECAQPDQSEFGVFKCYRIPGSPFKIDKNGLHT